MRKGSGTHAEISQELAFLLQACCAKQQQLVPNVRAVASGYLEPDTYELRLSVGSCSVTWEVGVAAVWNTSVGELKLDFSISICFQCGLKYRRATQQACLWEPGPNRNFLKPNIGFEPLANPKNFIKVNDFRCCKMESIPTKPMQNR